MNVPIIDLHQDLLLHVNRRDLFSGDHYQTSFDMLRDANIKLTLVSGFPVPPHEDFFDPSANELIEADFDAYIAYCSETPGWSIVTESSQIEAILSSAKGNQGLLLHVEGLNVFAGEWDMLERWYEKGWRSLGMVWNLSNTLGGGTKDPTQGLTDLGKEMLDWLHQHKMIIDFAHMNAPTFFDSARLIKQPILVSHGNAAALCNGPRNYTDEQLELVAKSEGLIGVFFASTYLVGNRDVPGTVEDVVDHIDHLIKIVGPDRVGIGSDFGGITTGLLSDLDSVTKLELLHHSLQKRGYSEGEIEKLFYGNAVAFLRSILS